MRQALGKLALRCFGSSLGRRLTGYVALHRPDLLLRPLGYVLSSRATFDGVAWPASVASFEDVAPIVLSSNPANRGVASMSLVEAALLWRLAAASEAPVIEIGRERGGSTFLIAVALRPNVVLHSYDPQTKHSQAGRRFDESLRRALDRFGLLERVVLSDEDSHVTALPDGTYGLVLVDGDPTLEGTRTDFERFCRRLVPGGHALFHDATQGGPRERTLAPLIAEIEADPAFERQPDVGTFAHFVRAR